MKIKKDIVKTDSKAYIKFTGLMGQNFVAIEGGSTAAPLAQRDTIFETGEQADLSTLMAKLEGVATGIEGLTKSFSTDNLSGLLGPITDFMKQNRDNLTMTITNLRTISDNVATGKGTVGKLINEDALYTAAYSTVTNLQNASTDLRNVMAHAENVITNASIAIEGINKGQGTLGKLAKDDALYTESTEMMRNLREISQKINSGQGSVGQLINNADFLKNAKLSLQKLDKATEGLEDQGPLSVLGIAIGGLF
jgi:phospholipid/cholesterol/gamma-HCH transport system substrate-binding protein